MGRKRKEEPKKENNLESKLSELEKNFGLKREKKIIESPTIKTGLFAFDYVLGNGIQLCKGCHKIELFGKESSGKCITGNSLITTKNGLETIDSIITHKQGFKAQKQELVSIFGSIIGDKVYKEKVNKTIKIILKNGMELEGTPEHPILTNRGFIQLQNIKKIDSIILTKGLAKYCKGNNKILEFKIKKGKFHPNMKIPKKIPTKLTKELGYIIGYYIGDGTLGTNTFQVTFAEINYLSNFVKFMYKVFGKIDYRLTKNRNCLRLDFPHSIRQFFQHLGMKKVNSGEKQIPDCILTAPKQIQIAFIRGYIASDGYINKQGRTNLTSKSEKLIKQLQHLLFHLGVESKVRLKYNSKYKQYYFSLDIERDFEKLKLAYLFNITGYPKGKILKLFKSIKKINLKLRILPINIETIQIQIKSIEINKKQKYVYDFSVPKYHFFTANNIINHNTTFALKSVAKFQELGKICLWVISERFDDAWAEHLGVDTTKLLKYFPETQEEATQKILDVVGHVDLIVIDSVATLIPEVELKNPMDKETRGKQAKVYSLFCRKLQQKVSNLTTTIMWINQIREKMGVMYGNPETTPSGRALKHMADTRIEFKAGKPIKKGKGAKEERIGVEINLYGKKNKAGTAQRKAIVDFYFEQGELDNKKSLFFAGLKYCVIELSGKTYTFKDKKVVGKDNFIKELEEKDWKEISKIIWERLK